MNSKTYIVLAVLLVALCIQVYGNNALPLDQAMKKVCSKVVNRLANEDKVDVLVEFNSHKWDMAALKKMSRVERLNFVHNKASAEATSAQKLLVSFLKSNKVEFTAFWVKNAVAVFQVSQSVIESIAQQFPNVVKIRLDEHIPIPKVEISSAEVQAALTYGLTLIGAPEVWAQGIDGTGIVVGGIDTGVRHTHEALKANYRGTITGSHDYSWFDGKAKSKSLIPVDTNGHGTHTMGTSVGSKDSAVGVAYGATWIAARGCPGNTCPNSALISSGEFMACPTKADGTMPDCSKAPHVVNNSWGGGGSSDFYLDVVDTWRAAGIIPVFAAGNEGSKCETIGSPGDFADVLTVGAIDSKDRIASFSSRGPALSTYPFTAIKPDITAPGVAVKSAYMNSDTAYKTIDGTSMATPHVTGVVALLLQSKPDASYDEIYQAITSTAVTSTLSKPGSGKAQCGGIRWNKFPNPIYGYGRVDIPAALAEISS